MTSRSAAAFRSSAALPTAPIHMLWIIMRVFRGMTTSSPAMAITEAMEQAKPSTYTVLRAGCRLS